MKESGFTATFPPNTKVNCDQGGTLYDVDWVSQNESSDPAKPTYAAVTARSYHTGVVNVLLMDGSCRSIGENIDAASWRAMATRANGDRPTSDDF